MIQVIVLPVSMAVMICELGKVGHFGSCFPDAYLSDKAPCGLGFVSHGFSSMHVSYVFPVLLPSSRSYLCPPVRG